MSVALYTPLPDGFRGMADYFSRSTAFGAAVEFSNEILLPTLMLNGGGEDVYVMVKVSRTGNKNANGTLSASGTISLGHAEFPLNCLVLLTR